MSDESILSGIPFLRFFCQFFLGTVDNQFCVILPWYIAPGFCTVSIFVVLKEPPHCFCCARLVRIPKVVVVRLSEEPPPLL